MKNNLPPGVTESMIPGFQDMFDNWEPIELACRDCGLWFEDHVPTIKYDSEGNDFEFYECPERLGNG